MSATAEHVTARSERKREDASGSPAARTPRRRWRLAIVVVLLLGAAGAAAWHFLPLGSEEQTQIELQGNIDVRQVNLSFKVDGRIESLAVDEGDTVKPGQVLATLDKRYFYDDLNVARARRDNTAYTLDRLEHGSRPEEIAQARAQLGQQKALLEKSIKDFARAGELVKTGAMAKEDYDLRESSLEVARANVRYAEETLRLAEIGPRQEDIDAARATLAQQNAALEQAERRLTDSDLIAPSDGIVLTRARERGAIVQPGDTIFAVTLVSPVWVRTYVNERHLGLIRPDMPATVTTDSAPGRPYKAHIGFISPTAEFTPKIVETRELRTDLVYRLRVIVDNPDGGLRQGMPVTVSLQLPQPRQRTFWQRLFGK